MDNNQVPTAQPGDTVELADKETGFYDAETEFKIVRDQRVELGDSIGKRTNEAIVSGGLLVVSGKSKTSDGGGSEGDGSDLPDDFPGRAALKDGGIDLKAVSAMTKDELLTVKGVGDATSDQILDYLKSKK